MTVVVPFDGSALAETALSRAVTVADCRGEDVVVTTVVPKNASYAREKGWVEEGEPFDLDRVASGLREQVREVAPDAEFRCQRVRSTLEEAGIARRIRDLLRETGASTVFLGSENVGRIAKPITSIGSTVAARTEYDIYIVQSPDPERE